MGYLRRGPNIYRQIHIDMYIEVHCQTDRLAGQNAQRLAHRCKLGKTCKYTIFLFRSIRAHFVPFWDRFGPIPHVQEFFQTWGVQSLERNRTLECNHFSHNISRLNLFCKCPKTPFLGHFGAFWCILVHLGRTRVFPYPIA